MTFIEAADTISDLNVQLQSLDGDLDQITKSLSTCNSKFTSINQTLGPKWQEIGKLSKLETDLSKLKHMSELPQMFKTAIAKFDSGDVAVFDESVVCYRNYSDVLLGYKNTKFIVSLYGEIKSYIARIRQLLNKKLE